MKLVLTSNKIIFLIEISVVKNKYFLASNNSTPPNSPTDDKQLFMYNTKTNLLGNLGKPSLMEQAKQFLTASPPPSNFTLYFKSFLFFLILSVEYNFSYDTVLYFGIV